MAARGWIGFDLDGTLAYQGKGDRDPLEIGPPIPKMVQLLKKYRRAGWPVKIFTARACGASEVMIQVIDEWAAEHLGETLPITCQKDHRCVRIYDDRAVQVIHNTGEIVG